MSSGVLQRGNTSRSAVHAEKVRSNRARDLSPPLREHRPCNSSRGKQAGDGRDGSPSWIRMLEEPH
jgi:hypothetical protein